MTSSSLASSIRVSGGDLCLPDLKDTWRGRQTGGGCRLAGAEGGTGRVIEDDGWTVRWRGGLGGRRQSSPTRGISTVGADAGGGRMEGKGGVGGRRRLLVSETISVRTGW